MKDVSKRLWVGIGLLSVILSLHLLCINAYAAEGGSSWRPTYDLIMRYINFGIIVFVVYKYLRKPFINFLQGRKEKVAEEIKDLETRREEVVAKINQTQKDIQESDVRFAELKERIVQQGERRKHEIVESARHHSQVMLDDVQRRIKSHLFEAKNAFKAELIDAAVDLAMQRLPREITETDNQKFLNDYLAGAGAQ